MPGTKRNLNKEDDGIDRRTRLKDNKLNRKVKGEELNDGNT